MKKLAILLVLVLATSAFAQGLAFGVKGGVNYVKFSGDDAGDAAWKLGFGAGAVVAFDVMDMLAIQGEVLYSMKGSEDYPAIDGSTDLTYIEIPVLFKYNIPMAGMVAPNIFVGPSVGILLSAEEDGTDVKDDKESFDYGVTFGAGVNFDLGTGKVTLDGRYTIGLASTEDPGDVKNGGLSASIGYLFSL